MAEWGLELGPLGTQTKQTRTHTSRARPPPSRGSHRTPQHPEPQAPWKQGFAPCAPTSPPSVSARDASLPPGAAHPRRSLTAQRGGDPGTPSPTRAPQQGSGTRSRVLSAHPGQAAHTRRSAQPSSSGAPGKGAGAASRGLIGETEADELREEVWEGGGPGTSAAGSLTIVQTEQNWGERGG